MRLANWFRILFIPLWNRLLRQRGGRIQSQILLAFLAMSIITASLGFFSVRSLEEEGRLVDRTFDRSLMSINFARAAAADFNGFQAVIARRALQGGPADRRVFDRTILNLSSSIEEDLSIAVERAQSQRVVVAASKARTALAAWISAARALNGPDPAGRWRVLDRQAEIINQQLDLLVNFTAGDGFVYRLAAHETIVSDRRFNLVATFAAIILCATIAWLLSRRVVRPIRKASEIAGRIADGDLDVEVPAGNADELGALLSAMETMRGNIKASMNREVDLRQSAQMRLADALQGSSEGIVVVDAGKTIVMANHQASRLLESVSATMCVGEPAEGLLAHLQAAERRPDGVGAAPWEVEILAGRWLRVSGSDTQDGGQVFVYSDISLLKAQQAALETANLWLDAALANLSHGLCLFDSTNQLRVFNHRFCEMFGFSDGEIWQGMDLGALIALWFEKDESDLSQSRFRARMEERIATRSAGDGLLKLRDGRTFAVVHRPLGDGSWLTTYEDVTERLQAAARISYMARHDALTGLPNRAFFAERIEAMLQTLERGNHFALICLDLDHFKEVNDTLGHPIGDGLLRTVAERLGAAIRPSDMVARLGGDEFAILLTQVGQPEEVRNLAERIIDSLNAPCQIEGHPIPVGVSIGISMAPSDGRSYDHLLKSADLALYRAKADGRNGFRFFEREMDERQQARRLIELDLREALAKDQFELVYQPVCAVGCDRIVGFEALVRWVHPTRGPVAPSDFIPIAEEMGLIVPIGAWVLRHACQDAMQWPQDVSVAVNVSATQLRHGALLGTVVAALNQTGLSPRRLVLEITETVLISNAQSALSVLDRFKAMGIRIAMDDFGTGYSSLSYLRSFPFDSVKIDKSFIVEITTRPEAAAIVRAVIALCTSLGMRTIAEGVETEAQLSFLKAEACNEAQGFFFSRPIAASEVAELLETQICPAESFEAPGAMSAA